MQNAHKRSDNVNENDANYGQKEKKRSKIEQENIYINSGKRPQSSTDVFASDMLGDSDKFTMRESNHGWAPAHDENRSFESTNYLDSNSSDSISESCYSDVTSSQSRVGVSSFFSSREKMKRKNLRVSSRPMSSLESCLAAQFYNKEGMGIDEPVPSAYTSPVPRQRPLVVTDGRSRVVSRPGINPLFFQIPGSNPRFSLDLQVGGSSSSNGNSVRGIPSLPSEIPRSSSRRKTISMSRTNAPPFHQHSPEVRNIGSLFFSFGVGVGILHAVTSTRKEAERLSTLLKKSEDLVEDLQEEIKMRDSLVVNEITTTSYSYSEKRDIHSIDQGSNTSLFNKSLKIQPENKDKTSAESYAKQKDLANVEAELVAELELLELNLTTANHQGRHSHISEIDPERIAEFVQGELKEDNLVDDSIFDVNAEFSKQEELYTGNFVVSPRDLSCRLHEVIEEKLQERITELEAELRATQIRLRAVEAEYHNSKKMSKGQDFTYINRNYLENKSIDVIGNSFTIESTSVPLISAEADQGIQLPSFCNFCTGDEVVLSEDLRKTYDNMANDDQRPLVLKLSGDALSAYNEAYDELTKMTSSEAASSRDSNEIKNFVITRVSDADNKLILQRDSLKNSGVNKLQNQVESFRKGNTCDFHSEAVPQGSYSSSGLESLTSPKQKTLELESSSIKIFDSPDNIFEDTSGSTPCSLKFVDISQFARSSFDNQISSEINYFVESTDHIEHLGKSLAKETSPSSVDGIFSVENMKLEMASYTLDQAQFKNNGDVTKGLPELDKSMVDKMQSWNETGKEALKLEINETLLHEAPVNVSDEEVSDASEDEEAGKMLIKRFMEKRKQGSPLLRKAKSLLAFLDASDSNSTV